jgi:hypothetical protein
MLRALVQPDKGTLCAHWLAVHGSALNDPASLSSMEVEVFALRALQDTIFIYTGHAIPRPLRAPLVAAQHKLHGKAVTRARNSGGSAFALMASVLMGLQGLVWLVNGDDAFAKQVRAPYLLLAEI